MSTERVSKKRAAAKESKEAKQLPKIDKQLTLIIQGLHSKDRTMLNVSTCSHLYLLFVMWFIVKSGQDQSPIGL